MNRETFLGDDMRPRLLLVLIGGTISMILIPLGPRDSYSFFFDLIPLGLGTLTWGVLFHYHVKRQNTEQENLDRFEDIERLNKCDIGIRASKRRITHRIVEEYAIEA